MRKISFIFIVFICGCRMDTVYQFAEIKNSSSEDILVSTVFDDSTMIADDILFYGGTLLIRKNSTENMYSSMRAKKFITIYFFDASVVLHDRKSKNMEGIIRRSLLNVFIISKDSLTKNKKIVFRQKT